MQIAFAIPAAIVSCGCPVAINARIVSAVGTNAQRLLACAVASLTMEDVLLPPAGGVAVVQPVTIRVMPINPICSRFVIGVPFL
ncbi:hypothetical protein BQ8794_320104 [Mesorhizobium prunaredense]|uniref:Uncharacterized protein n=1 Tax=Mesorhizobium prunaredense TaxID=1631249 RepID=A0A1R3VEM8_9HYPH|nr:hypothetical protein BQ8794_320104 [Mesorhizobium prunaredense]